MHVYQSGGLEEQNENLKSVKPLSFSLLLPISTGQLKGKSLLP